MEYLNDFLENLTPFLLVLIGAIGGIVKYFDARKTKKERNRINKTIQDGLTEIDNKQNKDLEYLKEKVEELLIISKIEKKKNRLTQDIKNFTSKFIKKNSITNAELKGMLVNGTTKTSLVFAGMLDTSLEKVNIETLETEIKAKYKTLRAGISIDKLNVCENFKEIQKNKIILPQIDKFILEFKTYQLVLKNGQLFDKFEPIAKNLIENIIIQSYNLYNDLKLKSVKVL